MSRPLSLQARRNAARRAAGQLMRTGLDCSHDLRSEEAIAWLAAVAAHIDSIDPPTIGAAAILETSGHERSNVQLQIDLPGPS